MICIISVVFYNTPSNYLHISTKTKHHTNMSAAFATTTTVNEVSNSMTQTVNKLADLAYSNSQYVISESILDYHVLGINTPDRKLNTITLAKKLCVEYIPSPKFLVTSTGEIEKFLIEA